MELKYQLIRNKKQMKKTKAHILRNKYIKVVKVGNSWNTYLKIGCQKFLIREKENKIMALWYGKMLSKALETMIIEENIK